MEELGIRVVIRDAVTLDDLGVRHAPVPIEAGDMIAFEHGRRCARSPLADDLPQRCAGE